MRIPACVVASVLMLASRGSAEVKMIPGVPIEFEVPGAPDTLAKLIRNKPDESVRMTIKVPADYDPSQTYPVLVFLNGGDGGFGGELNMAEPFMGGGDYVLVVLLRDKTWLEYIPFIPSPPNEVASTPVGMPPVR